VPFDTSLEHLLVRQATAAKMLRLLFLSICAAAPLLGLGVVDSISADSAGNFHIDTNGKLFVQGVSLRELIQQQIDAWASDTQLPSTSTNRTSDGTFPVMLATDFNGNFHINMSVGAELLINGMPLSGHIKERIEHWASDEQMSTPGATTSPHRKPVVATDDAGNLHMNATDGAELYIGNVSLTAHIQQLLRAWEQQQTTTAIPASTPTISASVQLLSAVPQTKGWTNSVYGPVVTGKYAYVVTGTKCLAYHLPTATVEWQSTITEANGRNSPNQPLVDVENNQVIFGWDRGLRALHINTTATLNGKRKWQYEHATRTFQEEGPYFVIQPVLYSNFVCGSTQFYHGSLICLNRKTGALAFEVVIPGSRDTRDMIVVGSKAVVSANGGNAVVIDLNSTSKSVAVIASSLGYLSAFAGDADRSQVYFIDSKARGLFAASTNTATIVWNVTFNAQFVVPTDSVFEPPKVNTRPAVHQSTGTVFAQQINGPIHAYASNGTALWQSSRCPFGMGGLVVQGELVYTSGATLCALWRFDGSLAWSVNNTNTVEDQSTVAVYDEGRSHLVLAVAERELRVVRHTLYR
jgi:hypothetical protein